MHTHMHVITTETYHRHTHSYFNYKFIGILKEGKYKINLFGLQNNTTNVSN